MLFPHGPAARSLARALLHTARGSASKRLPHTLLTAALVGAAMAHTSAGAEAAGRRPAPATPGGEADAPLPTVRAVLAGLGVVLPPRGPGGHGGPTSPPPSWEDMDVKELGMQVSLGSVAGFTSGYAVKKISKLAAFAVGLGFIAVQVARYYGVVDNVDWKGLEAKVVSALDADGDGRVTGSDLKTHFDRMIDVLGFNMPSGAAFTTAFILGLRYG